MALMLVYVVHLQWGGAGGLIKFSCFAFFRHAFDAMLQTFSSNFQDILDATLLTSQATGTKLLILRS